jgi:putative hydrolase of the HAD superfamily
MFDAPAEEAMRAEAMEFITEVLDANLTAAIFTNDLADFQSQEWIDRNPFIAQVHTIVDGSLTGHLKPSPRSYEILIEQLGLPPEQILYIDDQPMNIAGGQNAGLTTVWFDVTDPAGSYDRARQALKNRS